MIDQLVPAEHLLRKIDAAVDFDRIYEMVDILYSEDNGRHSVDPVVLFKVVLIQHLYGLPSLRRTADEISANICYRWFLGYTLQEETPHFSTVSYNFRHRFTAETVDQVFAWILEEVAEAGYLSPKAVFIDGTHIKANANTKKRVNPRCWSSSARSRRRCCPLRQTSPGTRTRGWSYVTDQRKEAPASQSSLRLYRALCHQAGAGGAAGSRRGLLPKGAAHHGGLRRRVPIGAAQLSPHRPVRGHCRRPAHVKRHKALAVRIAELTEDLEELRSEKSLLLQKFEYAEDAGAEAFRKDIATMEAGLKKLEAQEQKYSAELDKALDELVERTRIRSGKTIEPRRVFEVKTPVAWIFLGTSIW